MTDRRKVRRLVTIWTATLAVALIVGYGAYRAKAFAEGPKIEIESPLHGASLSAAVVEISGTAKNISFLSLNGAKIFTDESGAWKERIALSKGYNTVTVSADDRFGSKFSKTI